MGCDQLFLRTLGGKHVEMHNPFPTHLLILLGETLLPGAVCRALMLLLSPAPSWPNGFHPSQFFHRRKWGSWMFQVLVDRKTHECGCSSSLLRHVCFAQAVRKQSCVAVTFSQSVRTENKDLESWQFEEIPLAYIPHHPVVGHAAYERVCVCVCSDHNVLAN